MDTLLNRIVKEHNRLLNSGKVPDALYMNRETHRQLGREWSSSSGRTDVLALPDFLGMTIYEQERYLAGQFRIYCKLSDLGEF